MTRSQNAIISLFSKQELNAVGASLGREIDSPLIETEGFNLVTSTSTGSTPEMVLLNLIISLENFAALNQEGYKRS